jgi:menaquinone-dependent protoporphyrinogen oxidase
MANIKKILIGYASAHGSTAEVAEFIGKVLQEHDFEVTVRSVDDVTAVSDYDTYILGSAIHAGMWLTPMSVFFEKYEDQMAGKPVYFFMTCIRVLEPDGKQHALANYVHHETMEKLAVRDIGVFAGKLSWDEIDLQERWTLSLRFDGMEVPGVRNDDFRDWSAIRAWAMTIRADLEKMTA